MTPLSSIRLITSDDDFAALESRWNSLLERSEANTIFLRWEWLFTWWTLFGKRLGQLCIVVVEAEGETIGIAPCYIKNERFPAFQMTRTLRYLGTGEREEEEIDSEYLCILSRTGDEEEIVRQILNYILSNNLCDAIRLSKMVLGSETVAGLSPYCAKKGIPCYVEPTSEVSFIYLPQSFEDYLAGLTSAMRYEIRSDRRKLLKCGEVQFRATDSPSALDSDFEEMARLHRLRWISKGHPGVFENKRFSLFHKTTTPPPAKKRLFAIMFSDAIWQEYWRWVSLSI